MADLDPTAEPSALLGDDVVRGDPGRLVDEDDAVDAH
jgi:hypothetical protein